MSDIQESQKIAIEEAESQGFSVVRSYPTRLLLDLDTAWDKEVFGDRWEMVERELKKFGVGIKVAEEWASKSGKGTHVRIAISSRRALTLLERVLIEVCLGSDGVRGFLTLMRFWRGNPEPGTLFRPPKKKATPPKPKRSILDEPMWDDDDVPF